jgi:shikimate kinase
MSVADNVFLIGMPGVGKSTVGRALAHALGTTFVDADEEIVRRNGVSIATIFEIEGEAGFRVREAQAIDELTQRSGVVLATGGGAVLAEANRLHLRERGLVIYLHASLDVLERRTKPGNSRGGSAVVRPLLSGVDRRAALAALLDARTPLYNATAHLVADATVTQRSRFVQHLMHEISRHRASLPPSPNLPASSLR